MRLNSTIAAVFKCNRDTVQCRILIATQILFSNSKAVYLNFRARIKMTSINGVTIINLTPINNQPKTLLSTNLRVYRKISEHQTLHQITWGKRMGSGIIRIWVVIVIDRQRKGKFRTLCRVANQAHYTTNNNSSKNTKALSNLLVKIQTKWKQTLISLVLVITRNRYFLESENIITSSNNSHPNRRTYPLISYNCISNPHILTIINLINLHLDSHNNNFSHNNTMFTNQPLKPVTQQVTL